MQLEGEDIDTYSGSNSNMGATVEALNAEDVVVVVVLAFECRRRGCGGI